MEAVNDACARVAARLQAGLAPRGVRWWRDGIEAYWCDECTKSFNEPDHLARHKQCHTGLKPFKCDECGHACVAEQHLADHKRLHPVLKPFKCDECDHACVTRRSLTAHKRFHSGFKPFKCDVCGYACVTSNHLTRHKRIHTGLKPFKCDECGLACVTARGLTAHKLYHFSAPLVGCDECGAPYYTSRDHNVHKRLHAGLKPYQCDECDYVCGTVVTLARHERIHAGLTFKCDECGYASVDLQTLVKHLERIHDVGKHKCDYCLANRNSRNKHYDEALKANVHICRDCFKKATGFTSRIEKRWCEYTDEHLGTVGLMGSDDSLRSLGGCSKNRPDRLYGDQYRIEIDECDEKQHNGSSYSCEQRRISDFYNEPSICGKTMVVIRFNPDGYKPAPGCAKVVLKERLRLFVMLKKALRRVKALPKIVVFYMFYSRTNSSITVDLPHYHVDSEADIASVLVML